jgi:transcription initiation factor TFIIA small subunit
MALTDTLDDLISERRIEPQLAMKILANFDRSITEVLAEKVKARLTFKVDKYGWKRGYVGYWANVWFRTKGHLDTYRFCDEVWTFLIKDVTFKMENSSQTVQADKVKIVSCNSKRPGEQWYLARKFALQSRMQVGFVLRRALFVFESACLRSEFDIGSRIPRNARNVGWIWDYDRIFHDALGWG